jgi:ketosteroid isomerase-like protein
VASRRDEVLTADRAFFAALLAGDGRALDELLGADFLIVDVAAGGVTPGADFKAAVASRQVGFLAIDTEPREAIVRFYGETAVVIGRTRMALRLPDGARIDVASRYTHVFQRAEPGGWRLVSAQGTAIPA